MLGFRTRGLVIRFAFLAEVSQSVTLSSPDMVESTLGESIDQQDWFESALQTPLPYRPRPVVASSWDDDDDEEEEESSEDDDEIPGEVDPIEPEEDPFEDVDEEDFDDDFDDDFEEELDEEYDIEPDDDGMLESDDDDDDMDDDAVPPELDEEVD